MEIGDRVIFNKWPQWVEQCEEETQRIFKYCFNKEYTIIDIDQGLFVLDVHEDIDPIFGDYFNDIRLEEKYLKLCEEEWFVYILRCKDNSLYTGIAKNVQNRIKMHENGTGAKYTRGRGPFLLVYQEKTKSHKEALKKERKIKKMSKKNKEQLAWT